MSVNHRLPVKHTQLVFKVGHQISLLNKYLGVVKNKINNSYQIVRIFLQLLDRSRGLIKFCDHYQHSQGLLTSTSGYCMEKVDANPN